MGGAPAAAGVEDKPGGRRQRAVGGAPCASAGRARTPRAARAWRSRAAGTCSGRRSGARSAPAKPRRAADAEALEPMSYAQKPDDFSLLKNGVSPLKVRQIEKAISACVRGNRRYLFSKDTLRAADLRAFTWLVNATCLGVMLNAAKTGTRRVTALLLGLQTGDEVRRAIGEMDANRRARGLPLVPRTISATALAHDSDGSVIGIDGQHPLLRLFGISGDEAPAALRALRNAQQMVKATISAYLRVLCDDELLHRLQSLERKVRASVLSPHHPRREDESLLYLSEALAAIIRGKPDQAFARAVVGALSETIRHAGMRLLDFVQVLIAARDNVIRVTVTGAFFPDNHWMMRFDNNVSNAEALRMGVRLPTAYYGIETLKTLEAKAARMEEDGFIFFWRPSMSRDAARIVVIENKGAAGRQPPDRFGNSRMALRDKASKVRRDRPRLSGRVRDDLRDAVKRRKDRTVRRAQKGRPKNANNTKLGAKRPQKKKEACHMFGRTGNCKYGDNCRFSHVEKGRVARRGALNEVTLGDVFEYQDIEAKMTDLEAPLTPINPWKHHVRLALTPGGSSANAFVNLDLDGGEGSGEDAAPQPQQPPSPQPAQPQPQQWPKLQGGTGDRHRRQPEEKGREHEHRKAAAVTEDAASRRAASAFRAAVARQGLDAAEQLLGRAEKEVAAACTAAADEWEDEVDWEPQHSNTAAEDAAIDRVIAAAEGRRAALSLKSEARAEYEEAKCEESKTDPDYEDTEITCFKSWGFTFDSNTGSSGSDGWDGSGLAPVHQFETDSDVWASLGVEAYGLRACKVASITSKHGAVQAHLYDLRSGQTYFFVPAPRCFQYADIEPGWTCPIYDLKLDVAPTGPLPVRLCGGRVCWARRHECDDDAWFRCTIEKISRRGKRVHVRGIDNPGRFEKRIHVCDLMPQTWLGPDHPWANLLEGDAVASSIIGNNAQGHDENFVIRVTIKDYDDQVVRLAITETLNTLGARVSRGCGREQESLCLSINASFGGPALQHLRSPPLPLVDSAILDNNGYGHIYAYFRNGGLKGGARVMQVARWMRPGRDQGG